MRELTLFFILLFSFGSCGQSSTNQLPIFQDGDLIFQHSASVQSTAVQQATNSYYSHCGIIFFMEGKPFVFEAIEPVGVRSLEAWIESGEDQNYAVYRLKNQSLTASQLAAMKTYLKAQLNKHYDSGFNWSDKEMYCSELVFKTYKSVGIELCKPKALRDFNLESPQVRRIMQQRYGTSIPYDEPMVSPGQISESALLIQVH
ncbi:MAG: YiiX family permuted papain-like enzyme [Flavobacteriales bacterium]